LSTIEPDSNYIWDRVALEPYSQAQVQWCKFDWANIGLLNYVNGFEISDCIFRDIQCGFKAEAVDSTFCSNLLCKGIYNEEQAGIYFNQVADGCIEKNIVNDCENGIIIKDESDPEVKNNYFDNCNIGIDVSYISSPNIQNNEIFLSKYGVKTKWSHPVIINNNIHTDIGVYCYYGYDEINHNNIACDIYAIKLGYWEVNGIDINAQNNYFYTINEEEIQQLIYDKKDVDESQQEHIGIVNYQPFLTQEYLYAGIRGE